MVGKVPLLGVPLVRIFPCTKMDFFFVVRGPKKHFVLGQIDTYNHKFLGHEESDVGKIV